MKIQTRRFYKLVFLSGNKLYCNLEEGDSVIVHGKQGRLVGHYYPKDDWALFSADPTKWTIELKNGNVLKNIRSHEIWKPFWAKRRAINLWGLLLRNYYGIGECSVWNDPDTDLEEIENNLHIPDKHPPYKSRFLDGDMDLKEVQKNVLQGR